MMEKVLNWATLVLGVLLYLCEGMNASTLGPFFPPFAESLGLTETEIGLVVAVSDMVNIASQFLLSSLIRPSHHAKLLVLGSFLSGMSVLIFGLNGNVEDGTVFFINALLIRAVSGMGASFLHASCIPIVTRCFPHKAGPVTSTIQTFMGLGASLGPFVGAVMYHLGGFHAPFYTTGSAQLVVATLMTCLMIQRKADDDPDNQEKAKKTYCEFITNGSVLVLSSASLMMCAYPGFKSVAYSLFLQNQLGVTQEVASVTFGAMAATYVVAAPAFGFLVKRGLCGWCFTLSVVGGACCIIVTGSASYIPGSLHYRYLLPVFLINAVCYSALFGSVFLILERIAGNSGSRDTATSRQMVSSWFFTLRSCGRIAGSLLGGGLLVQELGFSASCLAYGSLWLVCALSSSVVLLRLGFYNRTYYLEEQPHETNAAS